MMKVKRVVCAVLFFVVLFGGVVSGFAVEKIDINTATASELTEIKGVGEVLANRIVEYRQAHGTFKSLEELEQVKGVGSKKLEKIKPYIVLLEN